MRGPASVMVMSVMALPAVTRADAPRVLPVQGFLTDDAGVPAGGIKYIRFALYLTPTDVTPWFEENHDVAIEKGAFTVNLGSIESLDLSVFRDTGAVFLGIAVAPDLEMLPRISLGSTPYAGFAQYAGSVSWSDVSGAPDLDSTYARIADGVPSGAIMFFDLDACPIGWSSLAAAQGRTLVGLPSGGTPGGEVGTPLTDREGRTHTHTVDPARTATSVVADHDHSVVPPARTTSEQSNDHTHLHNPASHSFTTSPHAHHWAEFRLSGLDWYSYNNLGNSSLVADWSNGMDTAGADSYPIARISPTSDANYWTERVTYTEALDLPEEETATQASSHNHTVTPGAYTSEAAGGHGHDVDTPTTDSGVATTGQIIPYVQFLVCRKD